MLLVLSLAQNQHMSPVIDVETKQDAGRGVILRRATMITQVQLELIPEKS